MPPFYKKKAGGRVPCPLSLGLFLGDGIGLFLGLLNRGLVMMLFGLVLFVAGFELIDDLAMLLFVDVISEVEQQERGGHGAGEDRDDPDTHDELRVLIGDVAFHTGIVFGLLNEFEVEILLGVGDRGDDAIDAGGDEDEVLEAAEKRAAEFDGERSPGGDEGFFSLAVFIFVVVDGILEHDEDDHVHHAHAEEEDEREEIIEEHKSRERPADVHLVDIGQGWIDPSKRMLAEDREAAEQEAGEGDHHDHEEDGEDGLLFEFLGKDRIEGLGADHAEDVHDGDDGGDKATASRAIAKRQIVVIEADAAGQNARGKVIKEHGDDRDAELSVLSDDLEEVKERGIVGRFFLFGVALSFLAKEEDEDLRSEEQDGYGNRKDHPNGRIGDAGVDEHVREKHAAGGHDEATDGGADGDAGGKRGALTLVIGKRWKHGPIANVIHGEEQVPQEVEDDHQDDEEPAIVRIVDIAAGSDEEHAKHAHDVADRADEDPRFEFAQFEMALLDHETDDRVVDAVPDESDHHRDGDDAELLGRNFGIAIQYAGIDRVLNKEGTDQGVACIAEDTGEWIQELGQPRDFIARECFVDTSHFAS